MQAEAFVARAIYGREHARTTCPACSHRRKKKSDQCLSIDLKEDGTVVYNCWHCSLSGAIPSTADRGQRRVAVAIPQQEQQQPSVVAISSQQTLNPLDTAYMLSRGISEATCKLAGLFSTRKFFRNAGSELNCIAFPYRVNNMVLSHKYRTDTKHFTQDQGGASTFYGMERVKKDISTLLITEGEIDALTLTEVGFDNAVSVPNGAPMKIVERKIDPSEDARFSYVWEARTMLEKMDRIILATDNDQQGLALQEELARRIGKHKCWVVTYPEGCKDVNDVLLKHGKTVLSDLIIDAKPFPIAGLYDAVNFAPDIETLYNKRSVRGVSTGISALDHIYTVYPGQMSIVTGLPSHGKSSWVDQVCVNLATQFQWKFALCSFENAPTIHIAHLMELKTGKPFFVQGGERITKEEYTEALQWVQQHFGFIDFKDTEPPTMEAILQRAQAAVQRFGIRGLVIDPYNYVRMQRHGTETDEISDMLASVQAFSKANDVHTWFVAHPTKMYGGASFTEARPGGMNVHGSMAWWAKADCGITVHRAAMPNQTIVDVWKCRYRWVGQQGSATINYDPVCGSFT